MWTASSAAIFLMSGSVCCSALTVSSGSCEKHELYGDSWSAATAPAGCGPTCDPVQKFFWLEDKNYTQAAIDALNATESMRFSKTLFSWTYHRGIEDSPADNIFPPSQPNCSSKYENFTGIWWDNGVGEIQSRFEQFFGNYSIMGGKVDRFVIDAEIWLSNWPLFDNPGPSVACKQQRALYIQKDSRWPPIRDALAASGMVFNETNPNYLWESVTQSSNYHVWNTFMLNRTADYFNQAVWSVVAKYYPAASNRSTGTANTRKHLVGPAAGASPAFMPTLSSSSRAGPFASSVSFTNYDYMLYNSSRSACVPDRNGNPYCADGTGAVQGSAAAPSLYMGFSGSGGLRDYLRDHFNLTGDYPQTPFNAMRWNAMQLRSLVIAAQAPNQYSLTEDIPVRPWVAFKTFSGSLTNGSDYYQEALLHFLLSGADDLNFWNPDELMPANDTSNLVFGSTVLEATWAIGCKARSWVFPDPRDPSIARSSSMLSFLQPLVLTGMAGVGEQGDRRRYRLTTAGGAPGGFLLGNGVTSDPLVFKVPPSGGDGGGANQTCLVTIPGGAVIHPELDPVSALGLWIDQPVSASPATVACQ